jgi:hypothetical protein
VALYLFVDESGNLDFSPSGTPYYGFGALSTRDPAAIEYALSTLKYELVSEGGEPLERFHATDDRQAVRDRVFEALTAGGRLLHVGALPEVAEWKCALVLPD